MEFVAPTGNDYPNGRADDAHQYAHPLIHYGGGVSTVLLPSFVGENAGEYVA